MKSNGNTTCESNLIIMVFEDLDDTSEWYEESVKFATTTTTLKSVCSVRNRKRGTVLDEGVFGARYIGWWWSVVRERCDRWERVDRV